MTKEEFAQENVQCIGTVWGEYDDLCTHQWVPIRIPAWNHIKIDWHSSRLLFLQIM